MFLQDFSNAIVLAATYILMAMGLSMIYGVLKILHIAHAVVYTIGAFVGLLIFSSLNNFWLALLIAMLASGLLGVLIYRGVYSPLLDKPRAVPLLASIGLFVMMTDLLQKDFLMGTYQKGFRANGGGLPAVEIGPISLTSDQVLILLVTIVLLIILYLILKRTRLGLGWQAVAQDRDMAGALGVNLNRIVALNFFLGSALAGAGGVLVGVYNNNVNALMGDVPSYKAFIVIVLGGMGSLPGVIAASLLLAFTENFLVSSVGYVLPRDAIAFLVLILMLMFRPHGLLGRE